MKKLILFLLPIVILTSCMQESANKNEFVINGTVDTDFEGSVYLQKRETDKLEIVDSAKIINQAFTFSGTIEYPEVYYINIRETKSLVPFFNEASEIQIDLNTQIIDNTKITGSATQDTHEKFLNRLDKFDDKLQEAYLLYKKAVELNEFEKKDRYDSTMDATQKEREAFIISYLKENNNSPVSPYISYRNSYLFELEELNAIMSGFDESLQASAYMPELEELLKALKRVDIGQMFVSFMQQDTSGVYVPLSDVLGGQYLLIDFWASWCSPCRQENPNLVSIYDDFKDKGFEILGVSFDTKKENWVKAIEDDNLSWPQVSDLKGWKNSAGKLYGVRSIPANVLFDKDGYIIAKNLRGEELREKLEDIFSSNI